MQSVLVRHEVAEDERCYQWQVALYFGGPWTISQQSLIDRKAIEWDCSVELALNHYFRNFVGGCAANTNEDGKNYFDLSIFIHTHLRDVYSPKVRIDSYLMNGYRYPRVVLEHGYILDKNKHKRFFLKDEVIDYIGQSIEMDSEYEYIEFKRVKNR